MAIEDILGCTPLEFGGAARRVLSLGSRPLAAVPEPSELTALVGQTGEGQSMTDILSGLLSVRPSGLLVLSDPDEEFALAALLRDGAAVGAAGPGELQSLAQWSLGFQRAYGSVGLDENRAAHLMDPARTYVAESVLEGLLRCDRARGMFAFVQGPVRWLDDQLGPGAGTDLGFLLLEHVRRRDELPRIEAKIKDSDRVAIPIAPPLALPSRPVNKRPVATDESSWDFFDDPDPAAELEWRDARCVFEFCDGVTTVEGLAGRTMLGRFRTLAAVLALVERSHVALMAHFETGDSGDSGATASGEHFFDLDDTG